VKVGHWPHAKFSAFAFSLSERTSSAGLVLQLRAIRFIIELGLRLLGEQES